MQQLDRIILLSIMALVAIAALAQSARASEIELPFCDEPTVLRAANEISLGQQYWLVENLPWIFHAKVKSPKEELVNADGRWCSAVSDRGVTGWIPDYWWIAWLDWRSDVRFIYRVHRNVRGGISVTIPTGQ